MSRYKRTLVTTTRTRESDLPSSGGHTGVTVTLGRCSTTSTTTTRTRESALPSNGGHTGVTVTLGRCTTTSTPEHGHESSSKTSNYAIFSTSQYTRTCSTSPSHIACLSFMHRCNSPSVGIGRSRREPGDGHVTRDATVGYVFSADSIGLNASPSILKHESPAVADKLARRLKSGSRVTHGH